MRIRTQNLLLIVPLFLGLAVLNGWLAYREQVAEIDWGMLEGVEALAIAAAEFIDEDICQQLRRGEKSSPEVQERLLLPIERLFKLDVHKQGIRRQRLESDRVWTWLWRHPAILLGSLQQEQFSAWGSLRRIFILAPDGRRLLLRLGPDVEEEEEGYHMLPRLLAAVGGSQLSLFYRTVADQRVDLDRERLVSVADLLETIGRSNVVFTSVYPTALSGRAMTAYAPIRGPSGALSGIFGVELEATAFYLQKQLVLFKSVLISGGILSLGILVASFISMVLTRKICQLNEAAGAAVAGNYQLRVDLETIEEIVDLGSTFNTMNSLLEEVLERTNRELIDSEQFRTKADLASEYSELLWKPQMQVCGNLEIAARSVSKSPTGDFFGIVTTAVKTYVILGRVRAGDALEAVSLAAAANSLIRQTLSEFEPESVFADLGKYFAVETWKCIFWEAGDRQLQWLAHTSGDDHSSQGTIALQEGTCLVFHTLEEGVARQADLYVQHFNDLPLVRLMEDLSAILAAELKGSMVLLRSNGK